MDLYDLLVFVADLYLRLISCEIGSFTTGVIGKIL